MKRTVSVQLVAAACYLLLVLSLASFPTSVEKNLTLIMIRNAPLELPNWSKLKTFPKSITLDEWGQCKKNGEVKFKVCLAQNQHNKQQQHSSSINWEKWQLLEASLKHGLGAVHK